MLHGEVNGYVDAALLFVDAELQIVLFGLEAECVLLRLQELRDSNCSISVSSICFIPDYSLVVSTPKTLLGCMSLKFVLIVILHAACCLFPLNALLTLRSFS